MNIHPAVSWIRFVSARPRVQSSPPAVIQHGDAERGFRCLLSAPEPAGETPSTGRVRHLVSEKQKNVFIDVTVQTTSILVLYLDLF